MKQISAFLLLFLFFSCKDTIATETTEEVAIAEMRMPALASPAAKNLVADTAVSVRTSTDLIEQKIIRDASLRFETSDMDDTYARITAAVKKHGAQIQNDAEGKDYETIFRNMVVRVPAGKFDAFLADVGKGVSYFDRKEISSADVTEEYIDTDARLKAKKKLEARYLELLSKANKVSEMLEIEEKLSAVREDIEAKEGRLRYMQNRVSMSTVNVEFYKKIPAEGGVTVSYGSKIWNAIKSGFNGISSFFLGLLNMWPIILILVVLIFWLRRKFRKRKNA